jgi:esterase/lipase superfamily enzyme
MPAGVGVGEGAASEGALQTEGYRPVLVFYGTDRKPIGLNEAGVAVDTQRDGDAYGGESGSLHYGTLVVTIPGQHDPGEIETPSWYERFDPEEHFGLYRVHKREKQQWLAMLKEQFTLVKRNELLVFIHGFNVSFRDAALRTAQIHHDLGFLGVPALYSWPSAGEIEDYIADSGNAEWSAPHLVEFLETVADGSGAKGIHIVAHSMGSRVLSRALQQFADKPSRPPIRQVILAAPDLDRRIFLEQLLPAMRKSCESLTLYASADDKALVASQNLHNMQRVGQGGADRVLAEGLATVDITGMDPGMWDLAHSTFAQRAKIIDDINGVLLGRADPDERGLQRQVTEKGDYWVFK